MLFPPIVILGYSEAAMYLQSPVADVAAVLSIHGQREFGVEAVVDHRLDLHFDDADSPEAGDMMGALRAHSRANWCKQNGLLETPPAISDVTSILEFARSLRRVGGTLLCHCGAGMSRAPAAGLICLAEWSGPGGEEESVAEIRRLRRGAVPHVGMVRFADQLLCREGRLLRALLQKDR
jgi:predicted protein tyrosine phosphatase